MPDDTTGERVKAYIVLKPGETATAEEITSWCRDPDQGLTGYRVPKDIEFRDELPETLIGKVLRRVLQEEERAEAGGRRPRPRPDPWIRSTGTWATASCVRTFVPDDDQELFELVEANRDRLHAWMPWEPTTTGPADTRQFIERGLASEHDREANGIWIDGRLAGSIGMSVNVMDRNAEIGYWIDRGAEGRGIVSTSVRTVLLARVRRAGAAPRGDPCGGREHPEPRGGRALGMTQEGVARGGGRVPEGFVDLVAYAMLADEWRRPGSAGGAAKAATAPSGNGSQNDTRR